MTQILGVSLSLQPVLRMAGTAPPADLSPGLDVQAPHRQVYHPRPRPTDLTEEGWLKVKRFFPEPEVGPRTRRTPVRVLLNATLFRLENQVPLRALASVAPDEPPWGSVHATEHRIAEAGLWPTIIHEIGRDYLQERLPKLIHSVRRNAQKPPPGAKVDVQGIASVGPPS